MRLERAGALIPVMLLSHLLMPVAADNRPAIAADERIAAGGSVSVTVKPVQEEEPERTYPSLPGAVHELPEWVKKNAPFDVVRHFPVIPPDENAALLYLDALYEFAPGDMRSCIAPNERDEREQVLLDREARTMKIMREGAVDQVVREDLVNEHAAAFKKLAEAQKRTRCVFEAGLGIDAMMHHAQAARQVVRLLDWRVEFRVAAGDIDAALDDVATALRLGRDLRRRGRMICQLVSVALDSVIQQSLIARILGAPGLKGADCDRLFELLVKNERETVDSASEGLRVEYLALRDLMHRLELREPIDDLFVAPGSSNGMALARVFDKVPRDKRLEIADQIDELLAGTKERDFAAAIESLNMYFGPLVEKERLSLREANEWLRDQEPEVEGAKLFDLMKRHMLTAIPQMVEACRRDRTRMGAVQCLVALRRWEVKEGKVLPPDLLTVCKAAGLKSVPIDEYSTAGGPLRFTLQGGEPVVYSVATDGKDDGARLDWNWGKTIGDWVFRLPIRP